MKPRFFIQNECPRPAKSLEDSAGRFVVRRVLFFSIERFTATPGWDCVVK